MRDNGSTNGSVIGFDASQNLVKGLRDGRIQGLVVQESVNMGYLGVKTLVAHIRGEQVPRRIDTGVRLVTPDVMDQPAVKELLEQNISKSLEFDGDSGARDSGAREPRFEMRGIRKSSARGPVRWTGSMRRPRW